ncbi:DUF6777 domain-containing protein [Streptomyces sp. NPDC006368]|uniref:DUF6777 domain-containing protein n=1 Tax=Streptomyces sp. NPDC006368 TaxID=3156760 RepID=UPI0033A14397
MRTTTRRRRSGALAALTAGLLVAGCGGDLDGPPIEGAEAHAAKGDAREVLLQSAAAQGPDPFTPSTVKPSPDAPGPSSSAAPGTTPVTGVVSGAAPGLYAGTRSVASCDVERQVRLLTGDGRKAAAFALAAGVSQTRLAPWLRGLTPVVLRSDTRVTGHGYRDDSAAEFQAVLQAGTAVLVDEYGAPRVRCASGSPLRSPLTVEEAVVHKGHPWPGFDPGRVVTVNATQHTLESLLVVSVVSNTLIERRTGTDGEADRVVTDEPATSPQSQQPQSERQPQQPAQPQQRSEPAAPEPAVPDTTASEPAAPADCPTEPPTPPGCPAPPSVDPEPEFQADGGPQDHGLDLHPDEEQDPEQGQGQGQGQDVEQDPGQAPDDEGDGQLMGPDNTSVEPEAYAG